VGHNYTLEGTDILEGSYVEHMRYSDLGQFFTRKTKLNTMAEDYIIQLTPYSRVFRQNVIIAQPVKQLSDKYGTLRFTAVLARAHHSPQPDLSNLISFIF
jgi:hypothetical protein